MQQQTPSSSRNPAPATPASRKKAKVVKKFFDGQDDLDDTAKFWQEYCGTKPNAAPGHMQPPKFPQSLIKLAVGLILSFVTQFKS